MMGMINMPVNEAKKISANAIAEVLKNPAFDVRLKKLMLGSTLLWWDTEYVVKGGQLYKAKYQQPLISRKALQKICNNGIDWAKDLRHEHAIPRATLTRVLLSIDVEVENFNQIVEQLLARYSVAIVVTKEEDSMLTGAGFRDEKQYTIDAYLTGVANPLVRYDMYNAIASVKIEVINLTDITLNNGKNAAEMLVGLSSPTDIKELARHCLKHISV